MQLKNGFVMLVLMMLSSCQGQDKKTPKESSNIQQSPIVLRKFKAIGLSPDRDTTLVSQYIRSIFQDSKGNLWFGTIDEGVVKYDQKTLTYYAAPDGFVSNSVFAINEDQKGQLWFGTNKGVYRFDGKSFRNYMQKDGLSSLDISRKSILVDHTGAIWVGTHQGVFQYNPSADSMGAASFSQFKPLGNINIAGILGDQRGHIWFASSNNGVFRYDGKSLTHFTEKADLGANYAGGIAEDKAGNIWFTMKTGICKYDGTSFTEYTAKDGLGGTEFWGIYIEASGIIWITARGSTTRFDPSIDLPNPKAFTVYTPTNGINCCVQSMFQDKSGKMWWGAGDGLYRFDGAKFYQVKQNGPW